MDGQPTDSCQITATADIITPYGEVRLCWRDQEIYRVEFGPFDPANRHSTVRRCTPPHEPEQRLIAQFLAYFQGQAVEFDCKLPAGTGTDFQRAVWRALAAIPYGSCKTYGRLAVGLALPVRAARAVGAACGRNPLPIICPCHRVVASTGALTGFSAGIAWKKALLQLEGVPIENERVRIFKNR